MKYWHVIGGEGVGDMTGAYMTMILGPIDTPDPSRLDLTKFSPVPRMQHLAVFDHEPTDLEKDQCQPLEFRDHRPDGKVINWDSYAYDGPLECSRAGMHLQDVDEDGYCNHCGHPDPEPEADIEAAIASIQGDRHVTTEDRAEPGR